MTPVVRAAVALGAVVAVTAAIVAPALLHPRTGEPGVGATSTSAPSDPDGRREVTAPISGPDRAWGPSDVEWRRALADAQALSLEQAAGLVIVPRWSSPDADAAARFMAAGKFGGLIVMGSAVDSAAQVRALTNAISRASVHPWDAIVSVDQEGGTVARLAGLVPDLPAFMAAGAAHDPAEVSHVYAQAAVDMRGLGFSMNFAPVADMTIGPADPTIGTRSAGDQVDDVSATVEAAVDGYLAGGVVPVIKHFPGHGSVTTDSHLGLPVQRASVAALEKRDIAPFAHAVDAGAPALMMAHIAVAEWGASPATLEPAAYAYVRGELGFDGLLITDALDMGAITQTHDPGEASVKALAAGADVLLMPADPIAARDAVVAAVSSGDVPRERLDEAAARLIALQRWQDGLGPLVDTGENYGRELAVAGATVAARECAPPLVAAPALVTGGTTAQREQVARGLAAAGIEATAGRRGSKGSDSDATPDPAPEPETVIALVGPGADVPDAEVLVALGAPWVLERGDADVFVALYGRSDDALAGLVDVLTGARDPGGSWPVAVDLPYAVCGAEET
ncbi:glycoside hydrolase family 3 N-terminal domain-containing protein [Demequina sp. NBRC 110053]|uniref:glycoside hydrolase family 3 N-terminal domain-containing protein n=1 Tax=Demequina sp. NBRC 110053 TaxID=1570342 RepID=UPI000A0108F5|nr:glycoside hydrolase family 3 N-terminal domain-containing protein [Demequina sp. NBRC 110053]